jgi:hypothetical protein
METAPAPAPPILDRSRFGQNPRTAATQHWNIAWRTSQRHLGRSTRQKSKSARSHARGRRWIGSGTNGKPSVRRQLLRGLAVVLSSRHAARNHLRDTETGRAKFLAHQTRKEKRTEPLIAPTNRQLKSFRKQKKRNLIRGSMSGQLHQRRPSTSNNGYEELDACFVVRDHNGRALLLIGGRASHGRPLKRPYVYVPGMAEGQ